MIMITNPVAASSSQEEAYTSSFIDMYGNELRASFATSRGAGFRLYEHQKRMIENIMVGKCFVGGRRPGVNTTLACVRLQGSRIEQDLERIRPVCSTEVLASELGSRTQREVYSIIHDYPPLYWDEESALGIKTLYGFSVVIDSLLPEDTVSVLDGKVGRVDGIQIKNTAAIELRCSNPYPPPPKERSWKHNR